MSDTVNHPAHYCSHPSGVEAIVICEHMTFNVGSAIKYCWRAGLKSADPVEDLKKAAWYIHRELERLERLEQQIRAKESPWPLAWPTKESKS